MTATSAALGRAGRRAATLRLVAINDVYDLSNLPKLQTYLSALVPPANAVVLAGDFLSPSPLSSVDGGRGTVSTLRAAGVTHACLGNHEADMSLAVLQKRIAELSKSVTVINTNMRDPPSEKSKSADAAWLASDLTPPYALVSTPCRSATVALLGMMSDEESMFRDGTFKGVPISDVKETFSTAYKSLVPDIAACAVPMTHQSLPADRDLARHMQNALGIERGIVLGGHEHHPVDEMVGASEEEGGVRIVKSGCDARRASLVDLTFDVDDDHPSLTEISSTLVDLRDYPDSPVVKKIADKHLSVIAAMEREVLVDEGMVPTEIRLSSRRSRFVQTTVGGFFCRAIKEEMEADVAIMNGASIKGGATYEDNKMSLANLKAELPFPTKMIVVPMTRGELRDAIEYSRTQIEEGGRAVDDDDNSGAEVPRRGYLQVDSDYALTEEFAEDGHEVIHVALPRNLLQGFCRIQPLMDVGTRLKQEGQFPSDDDFLPAIDLVTRYCCKSKWLDMATAGTFGSFDKYDLDGNGVLDAAEIALMMREQLGYDPSEQEVRHMIAAIDADGDGTIDHGEFSYLLATMERQRGY